MKPVLTESAPAGSVLMSVQALGFSKTAAFMLPVNRKLTPEVIVILRY